MIRRRPVEPRAIARRDQTATRRDHAARHDGPGVAARPPRTGDGGHGPRELRRRAARPDGRPWVELCMVASLDGSTVVDGRSRGLSNRATPRCVLTLRGPRRRHPRRRRHGTGRGLRASRGRPASASVSSATPVASTRRSALFTSGAGFLIVPEAAPETTVETVRAGSTSVDLGLAVATLGRRRR